MSVKTKLQSLLGYANETTGESDTNLTDAVSNLIDGYGGITPSGSISITSNGTYDVTEKETAEVDVPNPSTGTLSITSNGTYDVTDKASAEVNVPSQSPVITPLSVTTNGTYNPPTGTDGYAPVTVNVSGGVTPTKGFAPTAWGADGYITEGTWYGDEIPKYAFYASTDTAQHIANKELRTLYANDVTTIGQSVFTYSQNLEHIYLASVVYIGRYAFRHCTGLESIILPASVNYIDPNAFADCTNLTDIYVPWAEGAVSGAPWGATNATIHFSWTPTV